ncbi:UDP-N-acetylmuramoyl-tripeptide--D-alanyl-D-alanine ligase [Silvanigrella sp.]|jgi:UDP-N-acetylmuramoyl-tripeptide--D-alanyl-D-alanine ligase|uniref:UDP-N-acetylmuramoyl-tripeptide--D-alanyl-D- alanine ligase n=1 Tax=Silvanigrella sp. TaxID=2024976 RepID=UPI0037C8F342|nr:UDP-N-acetylmuramoyl-tripeptide--D-alanyl-D-alanine ligase [Silvanigrellaceae bacterium]
MWPLTANEIYQVITKDSKKRNDFENIIIDGVCLDSRKVKPQHLFVAIEGERFDAHSFLEDCFAKGTMVALVNKNSNYLNKLSIENRKKCIEVENVLDKFREFAKFMRSRFSFPVIGVAGSNGKTTTKEMLASLLGGNQFKVTKTEKSENGFLGMAVTLCQQEHNKKNPPNALVLEIGIDDIGAMEQHVALGSPDISIITALGPEHLEHLINWETAAKEELIFFQNPNTKRVWQFEDDKILQAFEDNLKSKKSGSNHFMNTENDFVVIEKNKLKTIFINKESLLEHISQIIVWNVPEESSTESDIIFEIFSNINTLKLNGNIKFNVPLPGKHNAANFALAFATAIMQNRSLNEIVSGWSQFVSPPMRSRVTTLKNGTILFNDCYNSSPMSLEAALQSIENKEWKEKNKIVILGDMLDLGGESKYWHEKVFNSLKNIQNAYLCLYGSAMYDCYKLLKENEDTLISNNNSRLFWRDANEEPSQFLTDIDVNFSGYVILIKGSRGMKLDRVVKSIEEKYC